MICCQKYTVSLLFVMQNNVTFVLAVVIMFSYVVLTGCIFYVFKMKMP